MLGTFVLESSSSFPAEKGWPCAHSLFSSWSVTHSPFSVSHLSPAGLCKLDPRGAHHETWPWSCIRDFVVLKLSDSGPLCGWCIVKPSIFASHTIYAHSGSSNQGKVAVHKLDSYSFCFLWQQTWCEALVGFSSPWLSAWPQMPSFLWSNLLLRSVISPAVFWKEDNFQCYF